MNFYFLKQASYRFEIVSKLVVNSDKVNLYNKHDVIQKCLNI